MESALEVGGSRGVLGLRELGIRFGMDPTVIRVPADHAFSNCVDSIHTSCGSSSRCELGIHLDIERDLKPETEWDSTDIELDHWSSSDQMENLVKSNIPGFSGSNRDTKTSVQNTILETSFDVLQFP